MRISAVDTLQARLPDPLWERARPLAEKFDELLTGTDSASAAKRTSLSAFAIRVASAAVAFASQVLLARLMGTFEYGIFTLVWISMVILGSLSCFGMQAAVVRFLPEYLRESDFARMRGLLRTSRFFVLSTSTLAALIGAGAVYLASDLLASHYVLPFLIAFIALPFLSLADALECTGRAHGWAFRSLTPTYILRPALLFVFMLVAWMLDFPINGTTGVICAVLATYMTTLGQLALIHRDVTREHSLTVAPISELPVWLKVALPIFLVEGFFFLLVHADIMMVGLLMQPENVAVYFAAVKTLVLIQFVSFAVKAGVAHRFAAEINNTDKTAVRELAVKAASWSFWPSAVLACVLVAAGQLILSLFGSEFVSGYSLLFVLVIGIVLRSTVGPAESLLTMTGHHKICAVIYAAVLAVNLVINAALIPQFGLMGAAFATASATILEALLLFIVVRRKIGVSMFAFAGPLPLRKM